MRTNPTYLGGLRRGSDTLLRIGQFVRLRTQLTKSPSPDDVLPPDEYADNDQEGQEYADASNENDPNVADGNKLADNGIAKPEWQPGMKCPFAVKCKSYNKYSVESNFNLHWAKVHENFCWFCDELFNHDANLVTHYETVHPDEDISGLVFYCLNTKIVDGQPCGRVFTNKGRYQRHIKDHHTLVRCPTCEQVMSHETFRTCHNGLCNGPKLTSKASLPKDDQAISLPTASMPDDASVEWTRQTHMNKISMRHISRILPENPHLDGILQHIHGADSDLEDRPSEITPREMGLQMNAILNALQAMISPDANIDHIRTVVSWSNFAFMKSYKFTDLPPPPRTGSGSCLGPLWDSKCSFGASDPWFDYLLFCTGNQTEHLGSNRCFRCSMLHIILVIEHMQSGLCCKPITTSSGTKELCTAQLCTPSFCAEHARGTKSGSRRDMGSFDQAISDALKTPIWFRKEGPYDPNALIRIPKTVAAISPLSNITCSKFLKILQTQSFTPDFCSRNTWQKVIERPRDVFFIDTEFATFELPMSICILDSSGDVIVNHVIDYGDEDLWSRAGVAANFIARQQLMRYHGQNTKKGGGLTHGIANVLGKATGVYIAAILRDAGLSRDSILVEWSNNCCDYHMLKTMLIAAKKPIFYRRPASRLCQSGINQTCLDLA